MIKYSKSDLWPTIGRKKKQQITSLPAFAWCCGGDGCSDGHVCLINAMARQSRAEKRNSELTTDQKVALCHWLIHSDSIVDEIKTERMCVTVHKLLKWRAQRSSLLYKSMNFAGYIDYSKKERTRVGQSNCNCRFSTVPLCLTLQKKAKKSMVRTLVQV